MPTKVIMPQDINSRSGDETVAVLQQPAPGRGPKWVDAVEKGLERGREP
jgi:hypothetical protein